MCDPCSCFCRNSRISATTIARHRLSPKAVAITRCAHGPVPFAVEYGNQHATVTSRMNASGHLVAGETTKETIRCKISREAASVSVVFRDGTVAASNWPVKMGKPCQDGKIRSRWEHSAATGVPAGSRL